jgi:hypothetical protein
MSKKNVTEAYNSTSTSVWLFMDISPPRKSTDYFTLSYQHFHYLYENNARKRDYFWCVSFFTYHRPITNATRNIGYRTIYTLRYRNICTGSSPHRHEPRNTRTPRSNPLRCPKPQRHHVPTRNAPQSCWYALPSQHESNPGPPWTTIQLAPNHTYIAWYNNHSNFPWSFPENLSD